MFVGLGGAGRERKYIFKDNLEANIIFILIYPPELTRTAPDMSNEQELQNGHRSYLFAFAQSLSSQRDPDFSTV